MDNNSQPADYTPLTSLVTQPPSGAHAGNGGPTSLPPTSYKREESAACSAVYVAPVVDYPAQGVRPHGGSLYPENTRMVGVVPIPPNQGVVQPAPQQPQPQPYQIPAQPQQRPVYGGGHEMATNPRLDPAGEVYTHIPRAPAGASSAYTNQMSLAQRYELAEFQQSKRRAAMYAQIFQSGLFPFIAGLLFLLFTCSPAHEAVLRIFTPFGLVHPAGGGLTLAGQVVQSVLFGFVFSFSVYLM